MTIKMERDAKGFACFSNKEYRLAVDGRFKVREKVGVVAEAFVVKGGVAADGAAGEVLAAIEKAGE